MKHLLFLIPCLGGTFIKNYSWQGSEQKAEFENLHMLKVFTQCQHASSLDLSVYMVCLKLINVFTSDKGWVFFQAVREITLNKLFSYIIWPKSTLVTKKKKKKEGNQRIKDQT